MSSSYPNSNSPVLKNLHLIISVMVVIPAAFIYGIFPSRILPFLFDFRVESVDLNNVFRAIMCLYLATAGLWVLGIFKPRYWETATLVNIVFMMGLAAGRILSLFLDGLPSLAFALGLFGELTLGLFSWYQFKKFAGQQPPA